MTGLLLDHKVIILPLKDTSSKSISSTINGIGADLFAAGHTHKLTTLSTK